MNFGTIAPPCAEPKCCQICNYSDRETSYRFHRERRTGSVETVGITSSQDADYPLLAVSDYTMEIANATKTNCQGASRAS